MGNIGGVRKKGLTLAAVEVAMREVVDERFPDVFNVIGPSADFEGIALQVKVRKEEDPEYVLCWWDQGEDGIYPGLIGGKHPRMGDFGYWLLSVIEYGIAAKLRTRIYDEGIGYYRASDIAKGAGTWEDFGHKMWNSLAQKAYRAIMIRAWREQIPEPLWPWFDGDKK